MTVNYGTPVRAETVQGNMDGRPYTMTGFVHDGDTGHDQLKAGEQCECGVLGLGVVPKGPAT